MKMNENNPDYIMSPKIDFAFKLLFGNPRNQNLLIALLSAILDTDKADFSELVFINVYS